MMESSGASTAFTSTSRCVLVCVLVCVLEFALYGKAAGKVADPNAGVAGPGAGARRWYQHVGLHWQAFVCACSADYAQTHSDNSPFATPHHLLSMQGFRRCYRHAQPAARAWAEVVYADLVKIKVRSLLRVH